MPELLRESAIKDDSAAAELSAEELEALADDADYDESRRVVALQEATRLGVARNWGEPQVIAAAKTFLAFLRDEEG